MSPSCYSPPVAQLFAYGRAHDNWNDWSGYLNLGLTAEHIPELIEIVTDEALYQLESEGVEIWTPVHAWRSLGELRAAGAIEALISVLRRWGDEDWWEWINEEFPIVFGKIGGSAIVALRNYLVDETQSEFARGTAASSLTRIGMEHPEHRLACIEVLTQQLGVFAADLLELNGQLVADLVDLKALESVAVIEQAFQLRCVDEMVIGDWGEVQVQLGLKTREEIPWKSVTLPLAERSLNSPRLAPRPDDRGFRSQQQAKAKAKRQQQKESRRKNRAKKK